MTEEATKMTEEATKIELLSDGEGITIHLHGREFPNAAHGFDRDQLTATIVINAAPFQGSYGELIASYELAGLHAIISEMQAAFRPLEPITWELREHTLELELEINKRGEILVKVKACRDVNYSAEIRFTMEPQFEEFAAWGNQLAAALERWPVTANLWG